MATNIYDVALQSGGYRTYTAAQEEAEAKASSQRSGVDKDTFIKLLITQMQNQDPLNPMEDREFIAQMAQFSALEQMQNLNTNVTTGNNDILEHISLMNNNLVKSQTTIAKSVDNLNTILKLLAEKEGIEIPEETETDETDTDTDTDTEVPDSEE